MIDSFVIAIPYSCLVTLVSCHSRVTVEQVEDRGCTRVARQARNPDPHVDLAVWRVALHLEIQFLIPGVSHNNVIAIRVPDSTSATRRGLGQIVVSPRQ